MATETAKIHIPIESNSLLAEVLQLINDDVEVMTLWQVTNVNAVKRLGMTDHGPHHFQIVSDNAIRIQRLLAKRGITMSVCADFGFSYDYAEVIVLLASLLHDVGMSIHRIGHEEFSLFLVNQLLARLLAAWPTVERTIITSEVLHAIISHRSDGKPLTIEAGIVRVADALDMTQGRSLIPYDESELNIHSVSALAIDAIDIRPGDPEPVLVEITMNHTAGIFQVDELLRKKVRGSGIERYLKMIIYMDKGDGRQVLKEFLQKERG